jgi:phosphoribosylanthranilate isomerase
MSIAMKFCGLTRPGDVSAAVEVGAAYMGLVFFEKSPRYVSFETARELALLAPPGLAKVALTVDADDEMLDALIGTVPLDMLQLHGGESPERVAEVRTRTGLPVMKALGIAGAEDLVQIDAIRRSPISCSSTPSHLRTQRCRVATGSASTGGFWRGGNTGRNPGCWPVA